MKALLIDGYTDEPAAFGVPPYISPKIRLIYGLLLFEKYEIDYFTIDQMRKSSTMNSLGKYDLLIIFGGISTPGRYIGGSPITLNDTLKILNKRISKNSILMGPITKGYSIKGGQKVIDVNIENAKKIESFEELLKYFNKEIHDDYYKNRDLYYSLGANLIKKHPNFPYLMIEIDISSGCERRDGYCSFCTESVFYGSFKFRKLSSIEEELVSLKNNGAKYIRFGRSANVLAYGYDIKSNKASPEKIEGLFSSTREILNPEIFHVDNGNPIFISNHRKDSEKILSSIVDYCTEGNSLSFGVESFDENVRKMNNLGGKINDIFYSIDLVNHFGKIRKNGIPSLLPGINLLYGLPGFSKSTYENDYNSLNKILESGNLIRRINIRKVMVFPRTGLGKVDLPKINNREFDKFKEKIRNDFDNKMLKKIFPTGTIIKNVLYEYSNGEIAFGRTLGTYPILIGYTDNRKRINDIIVVDHGRRSITGIIFGTDINKITERELKLIPGIGKKLAKKIILQRPFEYSKDFIEIFGQEIFELIKKIHLFRDNKE
jgi:radical SAM superfamily enzyme with C-terminal helix-hairpin-helix motif